MLTLPLRDVIRDRWQFAAKIGVLALVYVVAAKFGLSLAFATKQVTAVWPPTGIALAALLILGYKYWPGILLGAFIANIFTNEPALVAGGIAVGNTLEALTGVYLLRRFIKLDTGFSRITDFLGLFLLAGVFSTIISAFIGTLSLTLGGIVSQEAFSTTWLIWWVGDMMSTLIFAPLLLIYVKNKFAAFSKRPVETGVLFGLSLVVSLFVFRQETNSVLPLPYLVFPFIVWASLRFRQTGAVTIMALIAAVSIWGTTAGKGPFTDSRSLEQNLILLHTFLLVAIITAMFMAITESQKQRLEQKLRYQTNKLTRTNQIITDLLSGAAREPKTITQKSRTSSRQTSKK